MSEKTDKISKELGFEQALPVWSKPVTTAPKTPNVPQGRDAFQTPRYATELLIPFIPKEVKWVWEPACGDGRIVQILTEQGYGVYPSDIRLSTGWVNNHIHNFVTDELPTNIHFRTYNYCIITNPPFSIKDDFIERAFGYGVPFAFLINADYSAKTISWIKRGCEKIVPENRITYITPNIVNRVNSFEDTDYNSIDEIPQNLLYKYSSAQFHSMWLTYGFNLGRTETFVDLPVEIRKTRIL